MKVAMLVSIFENGDHAATRGGEATAVRVAAHVYWGRERKQQDPINTLREILTFF